MDVADVNVGQLRVKDEVGLRCQKLFQDFLEEYEINHINLKRFVFNYFTCKLIDLKKMENTNT